jgi:hypothetical protein
VAENLSRRFIYCAKRRRCRPAEWLLRFYKWWLKADLSAKINNIGPFRTYGLVRKEREVVWAEEADAQCRGLYAKRERDLQG